MDKQVSVDGPRPRIAPAARQVNDEIEVGFDAAFEWRWSVFERVGRAGLVLIMIAALSGVLGAGPLDHATAGTIRDGGAVDYQPVARFGPTTQITVHLPPGVASFRIDSAFTEPMGLSTILPELEAEADGGGMRLVFALRDPTLPNLVRLRGKPSEIGFVPVTVVIGDGAVRRWTEIVLP